MRKGNEPHWIHSRKWYLREEREGSGVTDMSEASHLFPRLRSSTVGRQRFWKNPGIPPNMLQLGEVTWGMTGQSGGGAAYTKKAVTTTTGPRQRQERAELPWLALLHRTGHCTRSPAMERNPASSKDCPPDQHSCPSLHMVEKPYQD